MPEVVVVGTFDSKAAPLSLLAEHLRDLGETPIVIDTSVYPCDHGCDYPCHAVAARAGATHDDVAPRGRAEAVAIMARGAAAVVSDLAADGRVGALVCMGGSNAATVFSRVAPALPLGIPKILMATVVAGDTRPFTGANDVVLLYPIVDVEGDNAILRAMIKRLATTAAALKSAHTLSQGINNKPAVALTMYGVTTPCVSRVSELLSAAGVETYVFHANGTGGRTVELFARQGLVAGVVDATISELPDELFGGALPAGDDRLSNAARCGVPQVIAPGAIDMINFGPRATVPDRFEGRNILAHNDIVTLVRTTPEECFEIGVLAAERLGAPTAATTMAIPLGGVSMLDQPSGPFWDPDAVAAFRDGFVKSADPAIEIIEAVENINEPAFADLLVAKMQDAFVG